MSVRIKVFEHTESKMSAGFVTVKTAEGCQFIKAREQMYQSQIIPILLSDYADMYRVPIPTYDLSI